MMIGGPPERIDSADHPPSEHTGRVASLRKLVFPALILLGLSFFALAGLAGRSDGQVDLGNGLEAVAPVDRAEAQARQVTVIADLAPGYTGVLKVNDITIPANQLLPDDGLNKLMFRPGEGKVIDALRPRQNCAEVSFWRVDQGSASAGAPARWCFNVI